MNIVSKSFISVSGIDVAIDRKNIKNLHIGVYPPNGRVRVATPLHLNDEAIRLAIISKLGWIKRQRENFLNQRRQSKREMVSGESHYFMGKRYLLDVIYGNSKHEIIKEHSKLKLYVRANTKLENRELVLNEWYRGELKKEAQKLILKWEKIIDVKINEWQIQKMKTKWGSCAVYAKKIILNLELAKKPIECIEYVVVHELVHLLERSHNARFKALMDKFLPSWRERRELLNSTFLGHEEFGE